MTWTLYQELRYATAGIPDADLPDHSKRFLITADPDIAAELAGGGGVKVTSADGTTDLSFGLYPDTDLANGTVHLVVKLTLLNAATVGDLYGRLYFSASESTVEDKAGAVSSYAIYMPLEDAPSGSAPQMLDWVSETNIGTSAGSMTSGDLVDGQVGNALDFDGSDDYINIGDLTLPGTALTVEAICRFDTLPIVGGGQSSTRKCIASKYSAGAGRREWYLALGVAVSGAIASGKENKLEWVVQETAGSFNTNNVMESTAGLSVDTPYAIAATFESATAMRLWINGVQDSVKSTNVATDHSDTIQDIWIGDAPDGMNLDGLIDELRISSVARPAEYFAYVYTDDFANASTFTRSATLGGGTTVNVDPVSITATPVAPALSLRVTPAPLSVALTPVQPTLSLTAAAAPLSVACSPVAPSLAITCGVGPLTVACAPVAPALSITVHPSPRVITCTVAAPSLPSDSVSVRKIACVGAGDAAASVGRLDCANVPITTDSWVGIARLDRQC